jgi:hypothetical protein
VDTLHRETGFCLLVKESKSKQHQHGKERRSKDGSRNSLASPGSSVQFSSVQFRGHGRWITEEWANLRRGHLRCSAVQAAQVRPSHWIRVQLSWWTDELRC